MNAPSPRVSVLLPARNAAASIEAAIHSLTRGTYGDLEILAVDDGSDDGTGQKLAALAAADPRVRPFATTGLGIVGALQVACAAARGSLIARQDADDLSAPDRLAATVALLDADANLGAAGCGIVGQPAAVVSDGMRRYERWQNALCEPDAIRCNAFVECPVTHATLVLRRPVLQAVGGWRESTWAEDFDLLARLLIRHQVRIAKVARPLYTWTEREDRLTRTHPAYRQEAFHQARVHYLTSELLAGASTVALWGTGQLLERWCRSLEQTGRTVAATAINPRQLRRGHAVIPPERLPPLPEGPHIVALGTPKSRDLVAAALEERGRRGGREYWMVG